MTTALARGAYSGPIDPCLWTVPHPRFSRALLVCVLYAALLAGYAVHVGHAAHAAAESAVEHCATDGSEPYSNRLTRADAGPMRHAQAAFSAAVRSVVAWIPGIAILAVLSACCWSIRRMLAPMDRSPPLGRRLAILRVCRT
jgi:hypothetical protein